MEEYSYNEQQQKRMNNIIVPLCRIVLTLVFFFWLSTHIDIARALSNKPLPIFIFINFIIFALYFLSNQKQFPDNVGSQRNSFPNNVDSLPSLHEDEHCCHLEENLVDKHIILMEKAAGEIVAVSSDNFDKSLERNHHHRRLERRLSKELVITMREAAWRSMDDMSDEEFRFAIDAFIDERNKEIGKRRFMRRKKGYIF